MRLLGGPRYRMCLRDSWRGDWQSACDHKYVEVENYEYGAGMRTLGLRGPSLGEEKGSLGRDRRSDK